MLNNLKNLSVLASAAVLALGVAGAAVADDAADMVQYQIENGNSVPQSLTGEAGDAAKGRAIMINRKLGNCLACHAISEMSDQQFHGEVGPPLDGVAGRLSEGEMRMMVINPKQVFPETIMPAFYRTDGLHMVLKQFKDKTILTAQEVEHVVAYLKTLN